MSTTCLVSLSMALLAAVPAHAFDTDTHDEITRRVTQALGYTSESGDLLNLGNRYTDYWDPNDHDGEGQNPPAHCDEERFVEASERIRGLIQKAACQLLACQRGDALESLGRTMHPVQDFFAHSDLVEIEARDQRKYALDFLHLPAVHPEVVCDPKTHLTQLPGLDGLTSDYFRAWDLFWKPPGKCSHREINKDHAEPTTADTADPEYSASYYPAAKARAIEEGVKYLGQAESKMFSAIRKAGGAGRSRLRLEPYLHEGGDCPYGSLVVAVCPGVDW